jgi:hypothetical protein
LPDFLSSLLPPLFEFALMVIPLVCGGEGGWLVTDR